MKRKYRKTNGLMTYNQADMVAKAMQHVRPGSRMDRVDTMAWAVYHDDGSVTFVDYYDGGVHVMTAPGDKHTLGAFE